jgi:predicted dehydrogenase
MRIGIIGFGFMGHCHLAAYGDDPRAQVVAISDPRTDALLLTADGNIDAVGSIDPTMVTHHLDTASLLADETIDAVSICTPTPTHPELAIQALRAGKHVLVEKPVARTFAEASVLIDESASRPSQICMPAMCMRFWPGWRWLRDTIHSGAMGHVKSAVFERVSAEPHWGSGFYQDAAQCGGAILDLHVHDVDFIRFCFGDPGHVNASGAIGSSGGVDHVQSIFHYGGDGAPEMVSAEGGWVAKRDHPFSMSYRVIFETATVVYDSASDPMWRAFPADGISEVHLPPLPDRTGYQEEIVHFLDCIESATPSDVVSLSDAAESVRLVEEEIEAIAAAARAGSVAPPQ